VTRWSWIVWIAVVLFAPMASAQDARTLFAQGQGSYALGHYEDAIDAWERAYALDPRPALQYNLAQAYGRLGHVEEEQRALTAYVEGALAAGVSPDDEQIVGSRARLVAIGDRIRRTGVQLSGVPEGASVRIDDATVEYQVGESIPVAPGAHRIVVEHDGHEDFNTSVVVRAGETMVVPVMLERETATATSAADEEGGSPLRTIGIAGLAIGGAGLVAGGVLGVLALQKSDGVYAGSADADSARSMALGADIALIGGGVIAATGLVLVIVGRPDDEQEPVTAVLPTFGRQSGGVVVFGRF